MGKIMLRGMLASEHAATPHTQSSDVYATDTQNTTSTTDVDMPGMSINISTDAHPVLIACSCQVANSTAGGYVFVSIKVDDVERNRGLFVSGAATVPGTISLQRILTLTAGSHTIKLTWRVDTGTGAVNYRTLQVIELKY